MTTILLKNKNTSAVPTAGDLTNAAGGAELALNVADKRMYAKDGSGNVVEMGTNPSVITATSITDSGLTATRVVFAGVGGLLSDSNNMTFNGTTLSLNALNLSNALTTAYGGTGLTSYSVGDISYYASGTALSKLAIGTSGQILTSSGTAPQWSTLSGVAVTTLSFGTTGFTPSTATSGAITVAGTLVAANGGTGQSSYTAGDLIYASGSTTLSKLAIGTNGYVMTSSGTAPQWTATSSISIGTATNLAGGATGSLPYQSSAGATTFLAAGTNGYILTLAGGVPTWAANTGISTGKSIAMAMIFGG